MLDTMLLTLNQTVNPNPNHPPTGSEGARRSKTIFERRDDFVAESREVAHLAHKHKKTRIDTPSAGRAGPS